ncbi:MULTISPECIES: serine/threonine-protein kinase [unclassified Nocardioides]|uniref:serine/threonine-protein kinase n=1 Tax=unclassified Nocardioides TaxID=2615069 RepID=UPI00138F5835|nr:MULTISPECIES: serine/threonine-protein kinase [unclassified Nocardioides]
MSLPELLGRLQRVDRIGVGGFATVWLYHDDELDSDVAVKALAENWAQRYDVRDRFLEEARILRRADSDHVVRVYDIGEADGTPYFVMSYADRGSLATLLEPGRPLPVDQTVDLVDQAAAGLSVLHGHGVIHRDIKPHNLLLSSRGTPLSSSGGTKLLVADLGVAKAMLHASGLTQVVGTPAYMAPEQATGAPLDTRADVHALGAVAYQMLTGKLAREGGIGSLIDAKPPVAASTLAPLPPAVDSVLSRALATEPDDRWPDVGTFATALRTALSDQTTVRRTPFVPAAAPLPARSAASTPEPLPQPPDAYRAGSSMRGWVLVVTCLIVLVATFGVAYGLTRLVE